MTKEEALQKAKEFVDNLTPEEINSIREQYKNVVDSIIIESQNKIDEIEKKIADNEKAKRETEDISLRTDLSEENRNLKNLPNYYKNIVKAYKNGGDTISFIDKRGVEHPRIPNFTTIKTDKIIFDEETILTDEMPLYIPYIDEPVFVSKGYLFDAIRIDKNKYILAVNGYLEKEKGIWKSRLQKYEGGGGQAKDDKQGYILVTLDQLVLINDYYNTKAKGIKLKEAKDATIRSEQNYDRIPLERRERYLGQKDFYFSLPAAIKKKITKEQYESLSFQEKEAIYKPFKRYSPKRLKIVLETNRMWVSFHNMYERFLDPNALPVVEKTRKPLTIDEPRGGAVGHPDVWQYWYNFSEMMKWKLKDIKVQREIESEIRKIAIETSFGESNTNPELKETYGILVKRQNGSKIQPTEIEQIRNSWVNVQKLFGGLSNMAKIDNLKISHTADKFVYASKASGMYIPSMKTIAVTNKYGNEKFQCIMAHEVAHYVDNKIGEEKGERYSTDNYEGTSGIIASKFRKLLNKKSDSDYINATKECFARALEQFFAIETFGENVTYYESATVGEITYVKADSYVSLENYNNTIKPLIVQFLNEEKEFFKYLVDLTETQINTELQKGIEVEQEHKKTFENVASGQITPEQAIVETAKEHISENPKYYEELAKIDKKIYPNIKSCLLADGDNENDFVVEGTKIYNKEGAEEWQIIGFHKTGIVLKHNPKSKLTNEKGFKEVSFDEFKDMFSKNQISITGINNGDLGKLNVCIKAIVGCMDKIDADNYKSTLEQEIEKAKKEASESPSKVDMSGFYKIVRESKDFEEAFKKAQSIKGVNKETADYFYSKYNPSGSKSGKEAFKAFYEEVRGVEMPKAESVESMFQLKKATDIESLNNNIEQIVKSYANRKMAVVQVDKYLNEEKPLGLEWVKSKNIKTRLELENYLGNLQNKLRVGIKKGISESAKEAKQEMTLEAIENMAIKSDKEMQENIKKSEIPKNTLELTEKAYELGKQAHNNEKQRVPAQDKNVIGLLSGLKAGESIKILESWTKGWDDARENEMRVKFPEIYAPKVEPKSEPKSEVDEAIEMITELLPDLEGEQKQEALDAIEMIKELK
jgi:hypothetical protein